MGCDKYACSHPPTLPHTHTHTRTYARTHAVSQLTVHIPSNRRGLVNAQAVSDAHSSLREAWASADNAKRSAQKSLSAGRDTMMSHVSARLEEAHRIASAHLSRVQELESANASLRARVAQTDASFMRESSGGAKIERKLRAVSRGDSPSSALVVASSRTGALAPGESSVLSKASTGSRSRGHAVSSHARAALRTSIPSPEGWTSHVTHDGEVYCTADEGGGVMTSMLMRQRLEDEIKVAESTVKMRTQPPASTVKSSEIESSGGNDGKASSHHLNNKPVTLNEIFAILGTPHSLSLSS